MIEICLTSVPPSLRTMESGILCINIFAPEFRLRSRPDGTQEYLRDALDQNLRYAELKKMARTSRRGLS
jgi:hypothetical protein